MTILKRPSLSLTTAVFIAAISTMTSATANPLAGYKWKNRLIVAFVPSGGDGQELRKSIDKTLKKERAETLDRDLLVIDVSKANESLKHSVRLPTSQRESLRQRLSIEPDKAEFVLIGKDGGVKARQRETLELGKFFALIDTMPMRKAEMRQD